MVNKGRIHREIRKFMIISLNLIKLDNELVLEFMKENFKTFPRNKKSSKLTLISRRN